MWSEVWFQRTQYSIQFSQSVVPDSLWPYGLQHARLPYPSPTPRTCSNSCPSSWWCHPTISSSIVPFSTFLQSFPASGSFPMSQFFASSGQSIGCWILDIEYNEYSGLIPLGLTDWISLLSKGLSRVFSNTTIQKHQFFSTQLSLYSKSHDHIWLLEKPKFWLDGSLLAKKKSVCFLICHLGWS